ncbi:pimeloyl-ACP methyl ester carboxylesterase [Chryseobacterium bernardetii]|uniref:PGAP1-like protein n=2 Tax=Chryseobacterium TaxID=59732 RepID=A0A543EI02_9FLAO|nr:MULTISPECIES: alpha/beta fold hydrolase [Chryseobacterium]MDR6371078.1 pimeloyl-ACP methyl ester carboxylesterase [Chryseobacterium vietnamense]MDR6441176.1 pimeloyl-ACP methyl ester carboxylesterase [Chryseobacterium bernardetii]TQM21149.1 PGAP1-like protein [Chryseobacterium aquifrigidense]
MKAKLPTHLLDESSETAVLFIHGLGGGYSTWNKFSSKLHSIWTEKDAFSLEYDNYYNSRINIPGYTFLIKSIFGKSIDDLATHLNSIIETVCEKYKHIILVCHSMGGLVARKYIINRLKDEKNIGKIRALITYATPHKGSSWANLAKAITHTPSSLFSFNYFKAFIQIKDLSRDSDFIKSLNEDWNNLNVNSKLDFHRVVGLADPIVSPESAEYERDKFSHSFADRNHFTIIKPYKDIKDGALMVTYNYLKKFNEKNEFKELLEEDYSEEDEFEY